MAVWASVFWLSKEISWLVVLKKKVSFFPHWAAEYIATFHSLYWYSLPPFTGKQLEVKLVATKCKCLVPVASVLVKMLCDKKGCVGCSVSPRCVEWLHGSVL